MQIWQTKNLTSDQTRSYDEFLRVPAMSMGIYKLPAGGVDPQTPHNEDESYYVVSGRAKIEVEGEIQDIEAGTIIFVPAHAVHRFKEIEEDLVLLVFFAPAESD